MWRVEGDVFFDDGRRRQKLYNDRNNPFETLRDEDFSERYRFPKEVFTRLLDILSPSLVHETRRSKALEPALQLCTALRYFSQGGYLPVIGDIHGISPRSAGNCIHAVSSVICNRMEYFINWPNDHELHQIKQVFYAYTHGFPCIVGAIDGTHVPIQSPSLPSEEAAFVNRKGFHSINCQIICDTKLKILDIDTSWPGSTHDAFILRNSHIVRKFEEDGIPDSWILGDSGYALSKWLLVPVLNPTTPAELRYNVAHKHARSCVERCNGVLKMRWRCLSQKCMFTPAKASKIIAACAALHNFAIANNVPLNEEFQDDLLNAHDANDVEPFVHVNDGGIQVRNELIRRVFT